MTWTTVRLLDYEHVRDATDLEQPKKEEREARSPRGRMACRTPKVAGMPLHPGLTRPARDRLHLDEDPARQADADRRAGGVRLLEGRAVDLVEGSEVAEV